jgi:hypothetical protein
MRAVDLLRLVVEDRRLDWAIEELVGVTAEELVESVVARDIERKPPVAPPSATPHLAQAGDGPGEGDADGGVEVADVDPELERVGRHDREQLAVGQPALDLAPLRGGVAGAIRSDPLRQVGPSLLLEPQPREALDQLHSPPRLEEADRPHLAADEVRHQAGRFRQRGRPCAGVLVDQRGIPHRHLALGARGAVGVHQPELEPAEAFRELDRVGDRGARQHEPRLGPVRVRQPAKAAEHVGHVRAEHTAIGVRLVDHHPGQVRERVAPALVVRQHPDMEHVRVREDQVRARPDRPSLLARGVAVVDRVAKERRPELRELPGLVLGQRLGGVEVERPRAAIRRQRVQDREVESERLPARRARGDDHMPLHRRLEALRLMRVELLDPAFPQRRRHGRMEPVGQGRGVGPARAVARCPHQPVALGPPQDLGPGGG